MQYRFGSYRIGLSASAKPELPASWAAFRCDDPADPSARIVICGGLRGAVPCDDPMWLPVGAEEAPGAAWFSGGLARFAVSRPESGSGVCLKVAEWSPLSLQIGLQHAVMLVLSQSCIGLHCATVTCGGRAFALCAPSGTGKTTLANLLVQHCGAAVVNGDFALLSADEPDGAMFEPTPFCGSSGICQNTRMPLSGIVFLEQAPVNRLQEADGRTVIRKLCSNTFTPEWDTERKNAVFQTVCRIAERVPAYTYAFAPTEDAAHEFRRRLGL